MKYFLTKRNGYNKTDLTKFGYDASAIYGSHWNTSAFGKEIFTGASGHYSFETYDSMKYNIGNGGGFMALLYNDTTNSVRNESLLFFE